MEDNKKSQFKAFRKIRQFKDAIKSIRLHAQYVGKDPEGRPIYDESVELPTLKFKGTVKLHGTNAGVRYDAVTDTLTPQKRTSDLGGNSGHFGFVEHVLAYAEFYKDKLSKICVESKTDSVIVFGEWVGEGVQRKVAISEVPKRFVVFEVYDNTNEEYLDSEQLLKDFADHSKSIYNIHDYKTFEVEVDTQYPEIAVRAINKLVEEVEACCPVARDMIMHEYSEGNSDRTEFLGEGIVWTSRDLDETICFKTKGEKHSKGGGKMATVCPIKAENVKQFIEQTVTEDRLRQCIDTIAGNYGGELQTKHIGELMKWLFNDILEEEGDALVANNLSKKDIGAAVANVARPYFMKEINTF